MGRPGRAISLATWDEWVGSRVAVRPKKGGAKLGKVSAAGEGGGVGVVPGEVGKAVRGRGAGQRRGRGGATVGPDRSGRGPAAGDRWPATRYTRLVGEIGAPPVGEWAGPQDLKRGAVGAAGMGRPSEPC
jgi:hypothetical protein